MKVRFSDEYGLKVYGIYLTVGCKHFNLYFPKTTGHCWLNNHRFF